MTRYVQACGGNTRKAMTLYRYNLQLSQELFTIISCFEIALRIAHHEPVCFYLQDSVIDTTHVMSIYFKMQKLFRWMGIDSQALLYGLDHAQQVCNKINELKPI